MEPMQPLVHRLFACPEVPVHPLAACWQRRTNLECPGQDNVVLPTEGAMARKPQVAVEPRAGGRWAVQTDGTVRADSLHDRKTEAVARGRQGVRCLAS